MTISDISSFDGNLHLLTDYLETEVNKIDSENTAEIVHQINNMALKVKTLLENILEWSRVHSGHIEFSPIPIEVLLLAQDAFELYQVQIEQHQINFLNQINPNYILNIDPNMINAVFRNLISNAIKYTPDKGTIEISLNSDGKKEIICIFNSGSYMTSDAINKLFKLDNKHNGNIWATSEQETGTSFYFSLPKH